MGQWEYTLGQAISWDEGYLMPRYPRHVAQAFTACGSIDSEAQNAHPERPYIEFIKEGVQQFAQRWGGLDDAVFLRVLYQAHGRDRLLAIFALGANSAFPEATTILAPFLSSPDQLERCATACMFALRRDERALPVLEEYLLHEPPQDEQGYDLPESEVWYASLRCRIASVLATWGPPSLASILRQSCIHLWEVEDCKGGNGNVYDQGAQDALCYALGRRGALAAFHGIALPTRRQRVARVYLALGYVHADERFQDIHHEILLNDTLKQELTEVLVEHFALSEEESRAIIRAHPKDIETRRRIASYLEEYDDTPLVLEHSEHVVKDILEIIHSRSQSTDSEGQLNASEGRDKDGHDVIDDE